MLCLADIGLALPRASAHVNLRFGIRYGVEDVQKGSSRGKQCRRPCEPTSTLPEACRRESSPGRNSEGEGT